MKLYATVTSERAQKAQGGQEFIRLEVNGKNTGDYIFTMRIVLDKYGKAEVNQVGGDLNFLRQLIEKTREAEQDELRYKTKGEKQKGEPVGGCKLHRKLRQVDCINCNPIN